MKKNKCCRNCRHIVVKMFTEKPTLEGGRPKQEDDSYDGWLMKTYKEYLKHKKHPDVEQEEWCICFPEHASLVAVDIRLHFCSQFSLIETAWQDIERIWLTVDQVYETRWDCHTTPEGVRRAA
jgi:hypothetical protein